jgi:hypothetical protein
MLQSKPHEQNTTLHTTQPPRAEHTAIKATYNKKQLYGPGTTATAGSTYHRFGVKGAIEKTYTATMSFFGSRRISITVVPSMSRSMHGVEFLLDTLHAW